MTRLITGLEVHRYAPELNKLHLRNRQMLPAPGITTIKDGQSPPVWPLAAWASGDHHREPS
ncbi:hypothetical protein [Aeromonas veronii]|uniref:hypothetical protein n=1 Tax=Aeromonas veronii TaxID=654 RepID=UPI001F35152A|nr:hypothetical protein [Aeromonas veronii]